MQQTEQYSHTTSPATTPTFWVGGIPVYGDLILAPMDGYSDLPFRSLARSLGSAMSYTEFINAIDVVHKHPHLNQRLAYLEEERPVVYQVFDDDPDRLIRAVTKLRLRNPDIIDINMGCSDKRVANRGAGAGLLRTPHKIAEIFSTLSRQLDIPVTGKIRLGWDNNSLNYREVAHIIEDNGGKLVAVHGRTKEQGYGGDANWDAIAEIKAAVKIPVIANGDVRIVDDIAKIKQHTACDAVMIARAAIGNPWIFSRLNRDQVSAELLKAVIEKHLNLMLNFYGDQLGLVLFRKYAARYISPYRLLVEQRQQLLTAVKIDHFLSLIEKIIMQPAQSV